MRAEPRPSASTLSLDHILIAPKWRRLRIGLLAAWKMTDLLGGGYGQVVSEIAPPRRESHAQLGVPAEWIPESQGKPDHETAVAKLSGYFESMGFEPLGRTAYHILSTARRTPTGGELLRAEPGDGE